MGFIEAFNDALNGRDSYEIAGHRVTCPHCGGGTSFDMSYAQLNTAGLSFLNLDWANRSGCVLICKTCSHVDWFLEEPKGIA